MTLHASLNQLEGLSRAVADRRAAERRFKESDERFRLAMKASRVGVWDVDLINNTRLWSPELKEILGLPLDVHESEALFLDRVDPDDLQIVQDAFVQNAGYPSVTFRIRRADTDELRWVTSIGQLIVDREGRPARRLGTMQDVTERKRDEQRLWVTAHHDPLTGLPNRSLFGIELATAVAEAEGGGTRVALLLVDVDHFKEVNDTLGHDAGDQVLRAVASRLRVHAPPPATVARLGGDEFAIIIPVAGGPADIARLADIVVQDLMRPVFDEDRRLACSASVGWALFPDHDAASAELLKNADIGLYAAKQAGRARHASFHPSIKSAIHARVGVLQRARDALARGEIVPYYQPKVSPDGRTLCGFEALLRLRGERGVLGPGSIKEAFNDPELAIQIGRHMLDLVIADLQFWRGRGLEAGRIAINVSAKEFAHPDFADRLLETLARSRLPPASLEIEVTETVFLGEGSDGVADALRILHKHGITVAFDDFGTGYASLTHLRQYPIDWLKIDQTFIRDLGSDRGADAIVASVIGLAKGLGIRVVAEGVETQEQADLLRRMGCDLAQGYLFARPMPAEHVAAYLTGGSQGKVRAPRKIA